MLEIRLRKLREKVTGLRDRSIQLQAQRDEARRAAKHAPAKEKEEDVDVTGQKPVHISHALVDLWAARPHFFPKGYPDGVEARAD